MIADQNFFKGQIPKGRAYICFKRAAIWSWTGIKCPGGYPGGVGERMIVLGVEWCIKNQVIQAKFLNAEVV